MTPQEAQSTFAILLAIGVAIWMLSLWFSLRIGECRVPVWQDYQNFHGAGGEVVCDMPPEVFFPRLKKLLRYQAMHVTNIRFAITEESESSMTFERLGPLMCNLPTGVLFQSVNIHFAEQAGKSVVRYQLNQRQTFAIFRKVALGVCLFVGIPVLTILSAVIWYFCVQSEFIAARYQVYQMLQMVHVLWPPFLFVLITSQMKSGSKHFIANVIEHAADESVEDTELNMPLVTIGRRLNKKLRAPESNPGV